MSVSPVIPFGLDRSVLQLESLVQLLPLSLPLFQKYRAHPTHSSLVISKALTSRIPLVAHLRSREHPPPAPRLAGSLLHPATPPPRSLPLVVLWG